MPTKLPRVAISLTPELHVALEKFTAESGMAKSQLISQLLSETVPVIDAMTEAYRLAKKSPAAAADRMRDLVQSAHVGLAQLQLDMAPKPKKRKMRRSPRK